jgi:hypothetical protein
MAPVAFRIPDSVAHLDLATVADVLVKHGANVRAAPLELGVPIPDLRQLTLVNQALINAAFEAEERRLDKAESIVDEALASDDSRRRDAAAYFVLRNSAKSKRRGWIPTANASVDLNLNLQSTRTTVIYRWKTDEDERIERERLLDGAASDG